MDKIHLYDKILFPVVTEKSTNLSELNKITVKVPDGASKKNLKIKTENNYEIILDNFYKKDALIKDIMFQYFEFYFLRKVKLTKSRTFEYYDYFLKRISETKKFNLDEESLFMEFEYKILNG